MNQMKKVVRLTKQDQTQKRFLAAEGICDRLCNLHDELSMVRGAVNTVRALSSEDRDPPEAEVLVWFMVSIGEKLDYVAEGLKAALEELDSIDDERRASHGVRARERGQKGA